MTVVPQRSSGDFQIPSYDRLSSVEPPLMDQPRVTPHVGLFRVSSGGRDRTGFRHRASPESLAGIKSFTRYNLTFDPVNSSKPPLPPQTLNNNRSSSSETRRPRAKLDRTQRSNSVGELSLFASGTAVSLGSQTPLVDTDKKLKGQLMKGKLTTKNSRQSLSDPGLAVTLEPIVGSGISVYLPPIDID